MRCLALPILPFLLTSCGSAPEPAVSDAEVSLAATDRPADNCEHSGPDADGGVSFIFTCSQRSQSPDGNFAVVIDNYRYENGEESYRLYATDTDSGREIDIAGLNDAFPFVLFWSPRPGWFAAEHHRGSGLAVVRVFEITPDEVVEHRSFNGPALASYAENFPCLAIPDGAINRGRIQGWSADGRYLAWTMMTRLDVCMEDGESGAVPPEKQVSPVSVISDLDTGEVVEGSVRVLDWDDYSIPTDGPYAQIVRPGE